jgi:hypothetical protein
MTIFDFETFICMTVFFMQKENEAFLLCLLLYSKIKIRTRLDLKSTYEYVEYNVCRIFQ